MCGVLVELCVHSALCKSPLIGFCSILNTECTYTTLPGFVSIIVQQVATIIIIIIFLHGLGRLTCSGIDELPSFRGASTISSSSGFEGEGVFRESGVVHSFEVVYPVLFVFESHVLYSRDL